MGNKFEVNNEGTMVLLNSSSDPIGIEGGIYYNNISKQIKFFDGTIWKGI